MDGQGEPENGSAGAFGRFFSLDRDVLVLSLAMFAFSLGFQMTTRYLPEYMAVLGAGSVAIGLFGTVGNVLSAVYPYPGGFVSDRIGSRRALTLFGLASAAGFALWLGAPWLGELALGPRTLPAWSWIFVGLVLAQAWKSLGLGATFAIVKEATRPARLATGFASTETFRRLAFLVGPVLAAGLIHLAGGFQDGFGLVLVGALVLGLAATVVQHVLYREEEALGQRFEGLSQIAADIRALPSPLRPLLAADTLVRFGNGMVYVFFVIVVTRFLDVGLVLPGLRLTPQVFFGILLGVEMVVALATMGPAARLAETIGLKPVVAVGFLVYGVFPLLLINAPADGLVVAGLFAFSGLRFAGLPAHKALIVGPAREERGGRVAGGYYLVRNTLVAPSAALGGWLYSIEPRLAFSAASLVALAGLLVFLVWGEEMEAYRPQNEG